MALYPPIVASSMPVWDFTDPKKVYTVYFSFPRYMSESQLRAQLDGQAPYLQCTIRRQDNNASILSTKNGIAINNFTRMLDRRTDQDKALGRYPFTFKVGVNSAEEEVVPIPNFEANTNYKVQLRFVGDVRGQKLEYSLSENSKFSEWSTVCLVRAVYPPEFYINELTTNEDLVNKKTYITGNQYNNIFADFSATYIVDSNSPSQHLKSWRLRLLNNNYTSKKYAQIENYTISDSGWKNLKYRDYSTLDNGATFFLNCPLAYEFQTEGFYKLLFEIETYGGLKKHKLYQFEYKEVTIESIQLGNFDCSVNEEQGYVKVSYSGGESYAGKNLVLRRSDASSNFLKWEDIKIFTVQSLIDFTYYDFTVESGKIYKYALQKMDSRGRRGAPRITGSILVQYNNPFLLQTSGNGILNKAKQLNLKYDFQISSYKTNVMESKTDTLGSRYPYIRRNGDVYYRSFSLSGTIYSLMDEASLFVSNDKILDNQSETYQIYKDDTKNWYGNFYDYTKERQFRERVEQFLYNSKPKLYKSLQQGNIFIKLMDVSFSPKNELGRLIYSFSATAYQIEEATISTFIKYNFISIGQLNGEDEIKTFPFFGQLNGFNDVNIEEKTQPDLFRGSNGTLNIFGKEEIPLDLTDSSLKVPGQVRPARSIAEKIKYNIVYNNRIVTDFQINWLRITFYSKPYLIQNQRRVQLESDTTDPKKDGFYYGHLLTIDNQTIIVSPPNNIYQMKGQDVNVNNQILIYGDQEITVDYSGIAYYSTEIQGTPQKIRTENVNGQIIGKYSSGSNLIQNISLKYLHDYTEDKTVVKQYLTGVKSVRIDTQPDTLIQAGFNNSNTLNTFRIDQTGELELTPKAGSYITTLRVLGRYYPKIDNTTIVTQKRYEGNYLTYSTATSSYQPTQITFETESQNGGIYSGDYLLKRQPVNAMIFYFATIRRDYYEPVSIQSSGSSETVQP